MAKCTVTHDDGNVTEMSLPSGPAAGKIVGLFNYIIANWAQIEGIVTGIIGVFTVLPADKK